MDMANWTPETQPLDSLLARRLPVLRHRHDNRHCWHCGAKLAVSVYRGRVLVDVTCLPSCDDRAERQKDFPPVKALDYADNVLRARC